MSREFMVHTVEYRFGAIEKLARPIQWFRQNGPCYTARTTVKLGRGLVFEVCRTSPYSPEINGMAEPFVKRSKRDYAWFGDLSSARRVMEQPLDWLKDYNQHAPHKGLKMRSPKQFIKEGILVWNGGLWVVRF